MENTFWFNLKPTQIDDNIDKVINYLRTAKNKQDSLYKQTIEILNTRCNEIINIIANINIGYDNINKDDIILYIKILGSHFLIQQDLTDIKTREVYFYILYSILILQKTLCDLNDKTDKNDIKLNSVIENHTKDLILIAINSLIYSSIKTAGFTWVDIDKTNEAHCNGIEPLILRITKNASFSNTFSGDIWILGKGSACIKQGNIRLFEGNKKWASRSNLENSISVLNNIISCYSEEGYRIKLSEANNINAIKFFTNNIIKEQVNTIQEQALQIEDYKIGDIMPVKCTGYDSSNNLWVATVDKDHNTIQGHINYYSIVTGDTKMNILVRNYMFKIGDVFDAKYCGMYNNRHVFDIQETYAIAINACKEWSLDNRDFVHAQKIGSDGKKRLTFWQTDDNYTVVVRFTNETALYHNGDTAIIQLIEKDQYYYYGEIYDKSTQPMPTIQVSDSCFYDFFLYPEGEYKPKELELFNTLNCNILKAICKLLLFQQADNKIIIEKYKILCVCEILATMSNDNEIINYIGIEKQFIENLNYLANGQKAKIKSLNMNYNYFAIDRLKELYTINEVLLSIDNDSKTAYLCEVIGNNSNVNVTNLCKRVLCANLIGSLDNQVQNRLKRSIPEALNIDMEIAGLDDDAINGGLEDVRTEFKTSFLIAPVNAENKDQSKNVLKVVCSFMNTEGGTLYLGVNDCGVIVDNAIKNDMIEIERRGILFHSGLDGYIRYITDRIIEEFGQQIASTITITPEWNGRVVKITAPAIHNIIVKLDNIAYYRNNTESRKMNSIMLAQREEMINDNN